MKNGYRYPLRPGAAPRRGFALLITIVLVAFLVLLLVGLATFTRVETQVADNSQQIAAARQNALMALNLAVGRLQTTTGPDQRVTATADLQPIADGGRNDPATGIDLTSGTTTTVLNNVDGAWRAAGRGNRHWVGAWKNGNSTGFNANRPAEYNPTPQLEAWLVSGNETIADAYKPTDALAGLTMAAVTDDRAALNPIAGAAGSYRLLVGKNTADIKSTVPASIDRAVAAPQIAITANNVPGLSGPQPVGHYAWWIGDEGVKARANLVDEYHSATPSANDDLVRLASAQRPAVEAITTTLATAYPENDPALKKLLSFDQFAFVSSAAQFADEYKPRYHDLTLFSRGVLSDTRHGGLRIDLTHLLSQGSLPAFRAALNTALPGAAPDTGATDYNPLLSSVTTPYSIQPPWLSSNGGTASAPFTGTSPPFTANGVNTAMDSYNTSTGENFMLSYSATWEQLWSYYNLGKTTGAGGVFSGSDARPRRQTATQAGIYPLLVQAKFFYGLRIVGGLPDAFDGTNHSGDIWLDIIPVVVLANPYNVALEAQDYYLRSTGGDSASIRLHYLTTAEAAAVETADPDTKPPLPAATASNSFEISNSGLGAVKLTIAAPRMEPGRAYAFTLSAASTTIPAGTAAQRALTVRMENDFRPANVLTFNTTKRIPISSPPVATDPTHVALSTEKGVMNVRLYSDEYTDALGDQTMLRHLGPHTYLADSADGTAVVYPIKDGFRHGGGLSVFIHDASNVADIHQAPFSQLNYRGLVVENAAYSSFPAPKDIAISWARTRVKNGASSPANEASPDDNIQDHLLWRDIMDPKQVRWGIFNTGEGDGTNVPAALSGNTGLVNILYDVPRRAPDPLPSSIAQLRHFNATGHIPFANWSGATWPERFALANHSFLPNYPIGNSYPNIFIQRTKVIDGDGGMGFQYDGSYLFNDALTDRFFFSTFPATGGFDFGGDKLVNNRYRPFRPRSDVPWDVPANFRTDARSAAKNLLVEGAFNVNSTSVEAWKALLASIRDVKVGGETDAADLSAPFARTHYQPGEANNSRDGNTVNAWTGTINFTDAELADLAREIVLQVRRRGPFLSLADFTNRRIIDASAADQLGRGLAGALQAAIDRRFNQTTDVQPASLRTKTKNVGRLGDSAFIQPTGISGFPGYIYQGDLLATLGAGLSARSDTFVIRTYGDAFNPALGVTTGQAWCEAVVQRLPDYIVPKASGGNDPDETPAANSTNEKFGRRYQIISFRWLAPTDI